MRASHLETLLGAVVVLVAAAFVVFVFSVSEVGGVDGYQLVAKFDSVEGLSVGSDVRVGGIKVGSIVSQELDPATYLAIVTIGISRDVTLPVDSSVQVVSESLLGGRYMSIVPGADDALLQPGDEIRYTQSAVNIEQLLGRFATGAVGGN